MTKRSIGVLTMGALIGLLTACGGPTATATPQAATLAPTATTPAIPSIAGPSAPTASTAPSPTIAASAVSSAGTGTPVGTTVTGSTAAGGSATRTTKTAGTAAAGSAVTGAPLGGPVTDRSGTCRIILPPGYTTLESDLWESAQRGSLVVLKATDAGRKDFATFIQDLTTQIPNDPNTKGFQQVNVQQSGNRYRLDFTTEANPSNPAVSAASRGTLAAVPASGGAVICLAEVIYPQGQESSFASVADAVAASLQAVKP